MIFPQISFLEQDHNDREKNELEPKIQNFMGGPPSHVAPPAHVALRLLQA